MIPSTLGAYYISSALTDQPRANPKTVFFLPAKKDQSKITILKIKIEKKLNKK